MEMSGKLLYARTSAPVYIPGGFGNPNRGRVSINEEDRARGREVRAQKEKEHRENEIKRKAEEFDRHFGMKARKVNVHDRLTGKAPIAYIPPKK